MSVGNVYSELERSNVLTSGAGAPSDSESGYEVGALYVDTTADVLYVNCGTKASSAWEQVATTTATQTLTNKTLSSGGANANGITSGHVACKVANDLSGLLDGSANDLFSVSEGDTILEVVLQINVAATTADKVIDVGIDADALGATADPDGILADIDADAATGAFSSNGTSQGDVSALGPIVADDDGAITITSSADLSADATLAAQAYMLYIPA